MFNIDPEGRSEPATEATYERAAGLAEIGQIALVVGDVNQSLPFYRDVLGLKFLFSTPRPSPFSPPETCGSCSARRKAPAEPARTRCSISR